MLKQGETEIEVAAEYVTSAPQSIIISTAGINEKKP